MEFSELIPYLYYAGSSVADNLGTYVNVKKNGSGVEGNECNGFLGQ